MGWFGIEPKPEFTASPEWERIVYDWLDARREQRALDRVVGVWNQDPYSMEFDSIAYRYRFDLRTRSPLAITKLTGL